MSLEEETAERFDGAEMPTRVGKMDQHGIADTHISFDTARIHEVAPTPL